LSFEQRQPAADGRDNHVHGLTHAIRTIEEKIKADGSARWFKGNREKTRQTKLFDQSAATRKCGARGKSCCSFLLFFFALCLESPLILASSLRYLLSTLSEVARSFFLLVAIRGEFV